jgi:hypothetical protein
MMMVAVGVCHLQCCVILVLGLCVFKMLNELLELS